MWRRLFSRSNQEAQRTQEKQKYNQESSLQRIRIIENFAQKIGASVEKKNCDGVTIWTIHFPQTPHQFMNEVYKKYAGELKRIRKDPRPSLGCRRYASAAVRKGITSGMLIGNETKSGFISYKTHGIGLDELPDGSVTGVDWSAREIDRYQNHYDILIIHAPNSDILVQLSQILYGGEWWKATEEEIYTLYKANYFDSPQELHELIEKYQPK